MFTWLKQNTVDNLVIVAFLVAVGSFIVVSNDFTDVTAANYTRLDSGWTAGTVIPRYFASFKLPIITGTANEEVGSWLPDLANIASIKVNQSGNWSDVLAGANLSADDIVLIPEGVEVVYDEISDVPFKAVAVKGTLIFDPNQDTKMTVGTIHLYITGELNILPASENVKSEIVFSGDVNTTEDPEQFNLGLVATGGQLQIVGSVKQNLFTTITDAVAGEDTISVTSSAGWNVGDELFLADTQRGADVANLQYEHQDQTEEMTIQSIDGNNITLNQPLRFNHDGYVANISRNVILRSDVNGDQGHILLSGYTYPTISYVQIKDLGRTTNGPIDNTVISGSSVVSVGSNQNHRHPLTALFLQNPFFFKGNAIVGAPRFAIANHKGTGVITGNTIIGAEGSGILTSTGVETGLVFNNIVFGRGGGSAGDRFNDSEGRDLGHQGYGYLFRGSLLKVENNKAVGYFPTSAYAYFTHESFAGNVIPTNEGVDKTIRGVDVNISTAPIQTYGSFNNNEAEGLFGSGLLLAYRNTLSKDQIDNLTIKNLAISGDGIIVRHSAESNFSNVNITGSGRDGSGVGIKVVDGQEAKISLTGGAVKNFGIGYETSPLGGVINSVVFDNQIDIDVKDRPGVMSLILRDVDFVNTARDNVRFNSTAEAGESFYAYNYNQTGKNYRLYYEFDNSAPQDVVALTGIKNGVVLDLDATSTPPVVGGAVAVSNVTSDGFNLAWEAVTGATSYIISIASEPNFLDVSNKRKVIATVDADTLTYRVNNISANTDVFVRVEAVGGGVAYKTYAKTLGGQGVPLATKLKSTHLYAPNILMLVMEDKRVQSFTLSDDTRNGTSTRPQDQLDGGLTYLVGYTGEMWQGGPWVIRRNDGSVIAVNNIFRESVPTGHFYDNVIAPGVSSGRNQDHLMDVEHRIFIRLDQNIGSDEILDITGPEDYHVVVPFSDKYLETPVIQLNQVGYNPRATKRYAYVSGWLGDGGDLSLDDFSQTSNVLIEQTNALDPRTEVLSDINLVTRPTPKGLNGNNQLIINPDGEGPIKEINLALLPKNDSAYYRVQLPGVGVSYRTMVSELATLKAFYVTVRGLFLNRWGRDLDCQYTDWCDRPQDHPIVYEAEKECAANGFCEGFFSATTSQSVQRSLVGGHHDAGDYDIRRTHYVVSKYLLRAFELNSTAFKDNQLNIPESGNGIPDLMDEILWNLAAWEQLQEDDGGIRSGVESYRHPGFAFADLDPLPYWTFSRDPYHTLRVAGLFAQASRLLEPFDSNKALEFRNRAIRAYDYSTTQGGLDITIGGPIMYASSELYRLTGDVKYKNTFEQAWDHKKASDRFGNFSITNGIYGTGDWYSTANQPILYDYLLGYLGSSNPIDQTKKLEVVGKINTSMQNTVAIMNDTNGIEVGNGHRSSRRPGRAYTWGNTVALSALTQDVLAGMQLDLNNVVSEQEKFNTMSQLVDNILGANPIGMSWITGLGTVSPQNILWNDSIIFQIFNNMPPMPGIPVYGIGDLGGLPWYDYGKNTMYPRFENRPTLRKFADIRTFIQNTEFTVTETHAPVASLLSVLLGSDVTVPNSWKPGQSDHKNRLPLSSTYTQVGPVQAQVVSTSQDVGSQEGQSLFVNVPGTKQISSVIQSIYNFFK